MALPRPNWKVLNQRELSRWLAEIKNAGPKKEKVTKKVVTPKIRKKRSGLKGFP